ncbi:hypothetical protein LSH36_138g00024 [Paralvinella palmiformis]|uniref:Trafficking protein particle complex subunit 5 n=1 Tax=Paralvinella palmiformis TaxID=53620 RepID=A0AAD9JWT4_9ANNE|nr:hypothetical protein LSH36_138g00024 [Paralvinella palmiformis]
MTTLGKQRSHILEKSLSKGKLEVNLGTYALLFSEIVQYCQNRVYTVPELHSKLSAMGQQVGIRILDILFLREKGYKRETKLLNMLLFIQTVLWKALIISIFECSFVTLCSLIKDYIIEQEPLVNKFISVPEETGSLNCAAFIGGIIEAVLNGCNFPAKVTTHWHKGTTFLIKFDESVILRDKQVEGR